MNQQDKRIIKRIIDRLDNIEMLRLGLSDEAYRETAAAMREQHHKTRCPSWLEFDEIQEAMRALVETKVEEAIPHEQTA